MQISNLRDICATKQPLTSPGTLVGGHSLRVDSHFSFMKQYVNDDVVRSASSERKTVLLVPSLASLFVTDKIAVRHPFHDFAVRFDANNL